MLGNHQVITPIAVNDIENAVHFYGDILGLRQVGTNVAGVLFECGGGMIGLHQSPTAGSGQATCAWWTVDDVEAVVAALKKRGVVFDKNYDLPNATQQDDVYILGDTAKAAWFRDLDGNILGVGNY